jgi:hypothetical protein
MKLFSFYNFPIAILLINSLLITTTHASPKLRFIDSNAYIHALESNNSLERPQLRVRVDRSNPNIVRINNVTITNSDSGFINNNMCPTIREIAETARIYRVEPPILKFMFDPKLTYSGCPDFSIFPEW